MARSPAVQLRSTNSNGATPCLSTGRTSGACPGYVIDHKTALKRGGADASANMQWQTITAAKAKDRTEYLPLRAALASLFCYPAPKESVRMEPVAGNSGAEEIRAMEHARTRALVNGEVELARQFHADDYELVNPLGGVLSKEQYLGSIAAGDIRYLTWDIESQIRVRLYTEVALIRYRVHIEVVAQGQRYPRARYWHTDAYEERSGRWQVIWSQATATTESAPD
jgi:hypothetical protein